VTLPSDAQVLAAKLARNCRLCAATVDDGEWRAICRLHGLEPGLDAGFRSCAKCIRVAREHRPKPRPAPLREPLGLRIRRGGR